MSSQKFTVYVMSSHNCHHSKLDICISWSQPGEQKDEGCSSTLENGLPQVLEMFRALAEVCTGAYPNHARLATLLPENNVSVRAEARPRRPRLHGAPPRRRQQNNSHQLETDGT